NGLFIFYVLLSILAFVFTFRQKVYHKAVLDKTSTQISGYWDKKISSATQFIHLKDDNRELQAENAELRKQLELLKVNYALIDSLSALVSIPAFHQIFQLLPVEIINNSVMKSHNYLATNKGNKHGVKNGMAVNRQQGILGYVVK